ncbi:hypothetical protein M5689_002612 [Euphorbia peplus]|nr:hypothetical protein M5689_002612 [Euphorbia peplus]
MSSVMGKIKVKALIDKDKNKVVFVESDEDFGDVLFSFFTIPMGTIVQLTEKPPKIAIGCFNNLYSSVQNLDIKYFRTQACKQMLLHPRNEALPQCRRVKISIDDFASHTYFRCESSICFYSNPKMLYAFNDCKKHCVCGSSMQLIQVNAEKKPSNPVEAGVFLKGTTRLVISDDLYLMHPRISESYSLFLRLQAMNATASALEVREFDIGQDEIINLLKNSVVSKQAFTQTLLRKNDLHEAHLFRGSSCSGSGSSLRNSQTGEAENGKIIVKLFISRTKNIVCFAEAEEDFVDLVFSFLTIPLTHLLKQIDNSSIEGCMDHLYWGMERLDVEYFKSSKEKEVLLNPKIAPKFGYDNQLIIGVEEVSCDLYFNRLKSLNKPTASIYITVTDPQIPNDKEDKSNGGFMAGPATFTVSDNLSVIPISPISGISILKKLDVPLCDIKEKCVHVGNKEAVHLLVASFVSESALTRTFLQN